VTPIEKWAEVLSLKYILTLMHIDVEADVNLYLLNIENNRYVDENKKIEITDKIKHKIKLKILDRENGKLTKKFLAVHKPEYMVYKLETEFNKNIYYEPETKNMLIETTTTGNNLILKMMTKPEYKNFLTNWNISNKKHWYQTIPSIINTITEINNEGIEPTRIIYDPRNNNYWLFKTKDETPYFKHYKIQDHKTRIHLDSLRLINTIEKQVLDEIKLPNTE